MRLITLILTAFMLASAPNAFGQWGCTDPSASNYDALATEDNGTCCYLNSYTFTSNSFSDLEYYSPSGSNSGAIFFPGTFTVCMEDGCAQWFVLNYLSTTIEVTYTLNNGEPQTLVIGPHATYNFTTSTEGSIIGCADPSACNFNPEATCPDNSCTYGCYGCTDSSALNFDADATLDDGSCCFEENNFFTVQASAPITIQLTSSNGLPGATINYPEDIGFCFNEACGYVYVTQQGFDPISFSILAPNGNNFVEGVTFNGTYSGPASIAGEEGCADPSACNFNPDALCPNFMSCNYACYGCTDANAPNYDSNATIDDGSCCANEDWLSLTSSIPVWITISQNYGGGVHVNQFVDINTPFNFCLPDGCYQLELYPNGPNLGLATISVIGLDGQVYIQSEYETSAFIQEFSKNAVVGCNIIGACNYDPAATCAAFNSCDFSCLGCTDSEADNYDPEATIDNGSCCYGQYTLEANGPVFWSLGGLTNYWDWEYGSTFTSSTFCPQNGCYVLYLDNESEEPTTYTITDPDGVVVASGELEPYAIIYLELDINSISGCMDQNACNYDPQATCTIYDACDYSCYGCTNPDAPNYESTATFDDGSCCTENWYSITADGDIYVYAYGLTNGYGSAASYPANTGFCMSDQCFVGYIYSWSSTPVNFTITDQNGNVVASGATSDLTFDYTFNVSNGEIFGCADPLACNFDPEATCSDLVSCDYSCLGCTDPSAPNFNPNATVDNGSCCSSTWLTLEADGPLYWMAYSGQNGVYVYGSYPETNGFCMPSDCFSFQAWSWTGTEMDYSILHANGELVYQGNTINSWYETTIVSLGENEVPGCLDPNACNYNPDATCDGGFCDYYCGGCTDSSALNYNPNAIWDDGSCFYTMEPPMIQVVPEESAALQDQYFVRVMVMNTGNGAPYVATTNIGQEAMMIQENGQYLMGPFPCDQNVVVSMHSAALGVADFAVTDPVSAPCGITQSVEDQDASELLVYPNPASNIMFISGFNGLAERIVISDLTGRVVLEEQNKVLVNNTELNLEELNSGVYNLSILADGKLTNRVIVIKK